MREYKQQMRDDMRRAAEKEEADAKALLKKEAEARRRIEEEMDKRAQLMEDELHTRFLKEQEEMQQRVSQRSCQPSNSSEGRNKISQSFNQ